MVGGGTLPRVGSLSRAGGALAELRRGAEASREEVHSIAAELGGSVSGERGIGGTKREGLKQYKDALELGLMRDIKSLLDPGNLMNPGKLLDLPSDARRSQGS